MIYRLLWRLLGEGLLKHYLKDQNKPKTHSDLSYAFTDHNGKKYYRYADPMNLPTERFNKMQEYQMWMANKLTPDQLDLLCNEAITHCGHGLNNAKNAARVAAILYQILERKDMIIPDQLVLNLIAVQLVREDELPQKFDNDTQREKVQTFIEDAELHDNFFLSLPELRTITNFSSIAKGDWMAYSAESTQQTEAISKSLKIYSSET